ncbi:MAG TPA: DUF4396 domain-containing protein [Candidatus Saccharimonadales bacterium]|nr:DUF4396 domain-containing protein [Candidatus Saccharimonadales bacterium]
MSKADLNMGVKATLHCLSGCAIGEIIGSVVGSGLSWNNMATEALTIPLAFAGGYGLTLWGLRASQLSLKKRVGLALASDSLSIISMEIVDTLIIVSIPGALAAGPGAALFWWSLALALLAAFVVTTPVNSWLIAKGKGHALVRHDHH